MGRGSWSAREGERDRGVRVGGGVGGGGACERSGS